VCDLACLSPSCNWDLGDCRSQCEAVGCAIAELASGTCESACNVSVCGFDHWDCTTEASPAQLFISATQSGANLGSKADPLWSLSGALGLMELPWATFHLLKGTHSLTLGPTSNLLPYPTSHVTVQTYLCTGVNDPVDCAQDSAVLLLASHTISLSVTSTLTLRNVILDGALPVRSGCPACLYCPYTNLGGGVLYDDKGKAVSEDSVAPQSYFTPYNSLRFISVTGTHTPHSKCHFPQFPPTVRSPPLLRQWESHSPQHHFLSNTSGNVPGNQCGDSPNTVCQPSLWLRVSDVYRRDSDTSK